MGRVIDALMRFSSSYNKWPKIFCCIFLTTHSFSQELYFDDGLFLESPRYTDTTKHKYTLDNLSYKLNSVFTYSYFYTDIKGYRRKLLFQRDFNKENPLGLVSTEINRNDLINEIRIEVTDELKGFTKDSSYTQTIICYRFLNKKGLTPDTIWDPSEFASPNFKIPCTEMTGVIDNKKNIFLHPPRACTFKILELNPFPLYYLDESINSWQWNVTIGGSYLDPRWISIKDKIHAHYTYKREPDELLPSIFGTLKCKITLAKGTSDEQDLKTMLKSYYHPKYGFVRLEYTNIDGSKLTFELIEMQ